MPSRLKILGSVEVEGLKECDAALAELSLATQGRVLRKVLRGGAEIIREAIWIRAPEDSGNLKESITTTVKKRNLGGRAYHKALKNNATGAQAVAALIDARRNAKRTQGAETRLEATVRVFARHAHFFEFGTRKLDPRPFIRPGFDAAHGPALEHIKGTLWGEIQKSAARARARAARLARKNAK